MPEFPDAPAWPDPMEAGGPDPKHNQPPLEDQIVLDFEDALAVRGLDVRARDIMAAAERAPAIDCRDSAGKAGDLISAGRAVKAEIEAERETLNRPLLNAQRTLKAKADATLTPMDSALGGLKARLDAYIASTQAVVRGDYGARVGAKTEWHFEITDPAKLPLAIRRHPAVVEAMEKVIRGQVRGGARSISGVRIWSAKKANVR
jgi:hypothetical protein